MTRRSDVLEGFFDALATFEQLLSDPAVQRSWAGPPATGGFTVGGVVVHTLFGVGWVGDVLDRPSPTDISPISAAEYYVGACVLGFPRAVPADATVARSVPGEVQALADRSRSMHAELAEAGNRTAAKQGHAAISARFTRMAAGLRERLPGVDSAKVLDFRPGIPVAVELGESVLLRTAELVIHGDDLATLAGVDWRPPGEGAVADTISLLLASARLAYGDVAVIRGLARGERAPAGIFPVI